MQTEQSLGQQLKYQLKYGSMTVKLIFVNVGVFIFIQLLEVIARLMGGSVAVILTDLNREIFTLPTEFLLFVTHIWGLFTSIFAHFGFMHILFNMVFLFFAGRMFEQIFGAQRLLYTYLVAGIAGGLIEVLAHLIFPGLPDGSLVVGASGSIMGIFIAIAFYRPNLTINFFGIIQIRVIFIALLYLLSDFINLGAKDGTAHFAHLGGAIIGLLSIQNLHSRTNIVTLAERAGNGIVYFFKRLFGAKQSRLKVIKNKTGKNYKTDEEYNADAKIRQEEINRILDKISKSGYDSLSKREKDFLFTQSKK